MTKDDYLKIRPFFWHQKTENDANELYKFLKVWCKSENRPFDWLLNAMINGVEINMEGINHRIGLPIDKLVQHLDGQFKVTYVISKLNKLLKVY